MCGILGIAIKGYTDKDETLVRSLFRETMIRGKHAAGISFVKNNEVITISEPIPADVFMAKQDISSWLNEDGNLYCIGHIRYSTSSLEFNQPMAMGDIAIVHNGVVSQEPPEKWLNLFGFNTKTKNDSELILRCAYEGMEPRNIFPEASMAVCEIHADKTIKAYRNHARPLYFYQNHRMVIFCSTFDIAKRSGIIPSKCAFDAIYEVNNFVIQAEYVETEMEDIQP